MKLALNNILNTDINHLEVVIKKAFNTM